MNHVYGTSPVLEHMIKRSGNDVPVNPLECTYIVYKSLLSPPHRSSVSSFSILDDIVGKPKWVFCFIFVCVLPSERRGFFRTDETPSQSCDSHVVVFLSVSRL